MDLVNAESLDWPIRKRIDAFVRAVRNRDLEAVLSFYAPGLTSFAFIPSHQRVTREKYRQLWRDYFGTLQGPLDFGFLDLQILLGGDIAICHGLNWIRNQNEIWTRWTGCLQNFHGKWFLVHEHASAPCDLKTRQCILDLLP